MLCNIVGKSESRGFFTIRSAGAFRSLQTLSVQIRTTMLIGLKRLQIPQFRIFYVNFGSFCGRRWDSKVLLSLKMHITLKERSFS